ncbi:MAG: hypothetical protein WBO09_08190 [Methylocystis silviterrae]|uniref:hypothetical protein n=1 Tax=Methylocystis silviterrae TaxID=2743612 RepID=UPI003C7948DF
MSPFVPPEPPDPPTLAVPLPPPEVGFGSPWVPADAENRDRILDWWRMWWRRVFFPWLAAFLAWLQAWLDAAAEYITLHAVNGHSWWKTDTPIIPETTTVVEIIPADEFRPLLIGDPVSDTTREVNYGQIIAVVDATHAEVQWIGSLLGLPGYGWWSTVTEIIPAGTTAVVLTVSADRIPQLNDLVVTTAATSTYGRIITVTDSTHVVVEYLGSLRGAPGIADLGFFDLTTPTLAPYGDPGDTYQGQIVPFPQMVGAFVLDTDWPCWVRVYASEAYLLADVSRLPETPLNIADDHGCYLDFVSIPSELSKTLTPGIMFTDIGAGVWLSIVNLDINDPAAVAVHFDYRIFRE